MSQYKLYITFVAIMALGLGAAFLVSRGYYPIALVGSDLISAKRFWSEYRASSIYYQNLVKTYEPALKKIEGLSPMDLQVAVLDKLVEDDLVAEGARREVGADLNNLVTNKLSKFVSDAELQKAASDLYGLDNGGFRDEVLVPQAEREILAGRLFLRGEKFENWLAGAKKSSRVIIFSPQFRWNGEKIESK